jgi:hypothetical protein
MIAKDDARLIRKVDSRQYLSHRKHFRTESGAISEMPRGQHLIMSRRLIFELQAPAKNIDPRARCRYAELLFDLLVQLNAGD